MKRREIARYYDPSTAQFLTVDPMVAVSLSPYGYGAGDPVNMSEQYGLLTAQTDRHEDFAGCSVPEGGVGTAGGSSRARTHRARKSVICALHLVEIEPFQRSEVRRDRWKSS